MNNYTSIIPLPLAEKLKEKGINIHTIAKYIIGNQVREYDKDYDGDMPIIGKREYHDGDLITFGRIDEECNPVCCNAPTYAEVFDWLMEKGWIVDIGREYDFATGQVTERFEWAIEKVGSFSSQPDNGGGWCDTWHEAANAAIKKALTLI